MKKIKIGVVAGVLALLMAFSSANTVAMADEAATKGNVVIEGEGAETAEPVILNNVTAKQLIVESGSENVLKINGGKIDTVSVVAPKMEKMGYEEIAALLKLGMPAEEVADMYNNYLVARKEINKCNPTIQVEEDAVIEAVAVSGGAYLNLEGGDIKEVVVNNNNNPEMITITIQNYTGKVTVDQKKNADGSANQLTVKLVNSNLTELEVNGQDDCSCSIQGDKVSDVASVNVNGSIYMVMNVPATDMVIAENAKKSSVRVYNNVENVVVNADNCDFSVAVDAKVTNALIEGDNVKVRYTGTIENAKVTGAGSDVKYAKITPLPVPTATPKPTKKPKPEEVKPEGTIVGNENCTTGWWTVHSDTIKVEEGETKSVTFWNYTSGQENWHNFAVVLQNVADAHSAADNSEYMEYAAVRADNYGWGTGYTSATLESNWNWDTFKSDMKGAKVELSITNHGDTADVKADITTKSGKEYYQNYLGITTGGDLYYCLTVEAAYLIIEECEDFPLTPGTPDEPEITETPEEPEITETPEEPEITETPEEPEGIVVGNTDCSSGWWTAFSDTFKVEAGTSKTVTFKNYTNGVEVWNNYIVILQNVADAHGAAENAAYKEYAVMRADNWGWGLGFDNIATKEFNWIFDTLKTDMQGATVELTVSNHGETADVVANITTANGTEYYQKYLGIALDGDLYFCL